MTTARDTRQKHLATTHPIRPLPTPPRIATSPARGPTGVTTQKRDGPPVAFSQASVCTNTETSIPASPREIARRTDIRIGPTARRVLLPHYSPQSEQQHTVRAGTRRKSGIHLLSIQLTSRTWRARVILRRRHGNTAVRMRILGRNHMIERARRCTTRIRTLQGLRRLLLLLLRLLGLPTPPTPPTLLIHLPPQAPNHREISTLCLAFHATPRLQM